MQVQSREEGAKKSVSIPCQEKFPWNLDQGSWIPNFCIVYLEKDGKSFERVARAERSPLACVTAVFVVKLPYILKGTTLRVVLGFVT